MTAVILTAQGGKVRSLKKSSILMSAVHRVWKPDGNQ